MSAKTKKNVAAEALMEMDKIKATIKEESKSTIDSLLKEAVKDYMRDSIDSEDEDDMEIQDDEKETTDGGFEDSETGSDEEESSTEEVSDDETGSTEDETSTEVPVETDDESAEGEQEGDEWSEFEKFKVDDDTYDLTGEKDYNNVVKVYKLLKDDDNVIVKKDGDKVTLKDAENDAEYVIDLGTDDGDEVASAEEGELNEGDDNIAGIPTIKENKKNRKNMKENKERIFEVDLGYTDNYQKEDPLDSNLSMSEPGKGKDWDKGLPKGTEKPWVGSKVKSAGDPFGKQVNEGEELTDITEPGTEETVEEAKNVGGAVQQRSSSKSDIPAGREEYVPQGTRHASFAGDYKEVKLAESILAKSEAILKENKELKDTLVKVKSALQEALMVNVNLGKVTKLFLENTTTKKEKVDIINRFNDVKTIDQSNALYESIKHELSNAKQSVMLEEKSINAQGSAINENKIYEAEEFNTMRDFIKRMENC